MKMTKLSPGQALILAVSLLAVALLACSLNPVMKIPSTIPTAEVIFTAPGTVVALATDTKENVYAVTIEGNVLKIAPDGKSEQIYSGLERCGFSDRTLTVLPNGDVILNDCVEKKDTLIKIDQEGNKTTLVRLEENITSITSDSSGKLYLGFWTSQGNISVNFQPTTYLGGADDIGGHVSVLGQDGQMESLYEGGIPLSLAASEEGELYAAIWGQKGRFKPGSKSYSMCGPTKNFWIGLSDQVEIQQLAPEQKVPIVKSEVSGIFSHIAGGKKGLFAFGKLGGGECGIYQIKQEGNPQRLSLTEDDADKNVTDLAVSDDNLYFSDVDGNVYRVGLKSLGAASGAAELPVVASAPTTAATQPSPVPPTATPMPSTNTPPPAATAPLAVSATDTPQPTPTPVSPSPTAIPPSTLQVTQLALYEDAANHFAWSPDSKSLVIAASKIILYDVQTAKTQEISSSSARQVAFSPDGTMLASAAYDGVKLWDTAGWGELRTLASSQNTESVAFSPDGRMLVAAIGGTVKLWDVASGNELRTIPADSSVTTVAFSPDGRTVASGGLSDVKLWDVESGDQLHALKGHSNWIHSVVFSPDGQTLASGSVDNTVRLWDVASGRQLRAFTGHTGQVESVAFSPDGQLLASGSWDLTVKLWDVASGKELVSLTGHAGAVGCVAFSPDGTMLASGSGDQMRLWRIELGVAMPEPTPTLSPPVSVVTPVPLSESAISPDNAEQVTQLHLLESDLVKQIVWSPDGKLLAIATYHIQLYDAQTLKQSYVIDSVQWVYSIAFSPDGTLLAAPSGDGVKLWDTTGWGELRTFAGSKGAESLAFSPDGRVLATATGGTVKLWEVASGNELRTIPADSSVNTVAFSPDGRTVASGGLSDVKLWEVASGNELHTLKGHSNWINSVVFSPDGQTLASGSVDSTVRLWDVATGRQLRAFTGHTKEVTSVAFSPDGRLLASASWDLTVKLWEVASGRELRTLTGHTGWVQSVAFSPDGAVLASGSEVVRLWGLAP